MTNYMGKGRLLNILSNYLILTAPDRLAVLNESRGKHNHDIVYYRKHRGSEWLEVNVAVDESTSYEYMIFSDVAHSDGRRRIDLTEKRERWNENKQDVDEFEVFYGHGFYDERFNPIDGNGVLQCFEIAKRSAE